jgi:SAM-dependent methyltransferase
MARREDGSAGDADYGAIGNNYARYRQAEPRIMEQILFALGKAETVLNVGAGAGSYEPTDRQVTAVEPSAAMRAQRPATLTRAIAGIAEALPFPDQSFDASMATFSVHQWSDLHAGLAEMRRVTRGPVVILSCDPTALERFWLHQYAPEVTEIEARRYPRIEEIKAALGGEVEARPVSIPLNCRDGFNEAYYGRPEMLLEHGARLACSGWSFVPAAAVARFVLTLGGDLASGAWDRDFGDLRRKPNFEGPLRLVIGRPLHQGARRGWRL